MKLHLIMLVLFFDLVLIHQAGNSHPASTIKAYEIGKGGTNHISEKFNFNNQDSGVKSEDLNSIGGYLFAHMTSDDYGSLHYSISKDGLHWRQVNNGNRVLDTYRGHPDIITGHDGKYYLTGNPPDGKKIRIWTSDNYIDWHFLLDLQPDMSALPEFNPVTYWHGAPKMFYDQESKKYIITWHSATRDRDSVLPDEYWGSMRTLYVMSHDLKTISQPRRLFSFDLATIDVIIRKMDGHYYAILKDERAPDADWPTGKSIRIARSDKVDGPYEFPGEPISPNFREAPMLIPQVDGIGYYLYYEQYPGKQYEMSIAEKIEGPWYSAYINSYKIPENARHGCMVSLSSNEYKALQEQFGNSIELSGTGDVWLYAGFKDPGDSGIYFSISTDGLNWEELKNGKAWVNPSVDMRRTRDPFIVRDPRKGFHMVWTASENKIGYAHSEDLVHWSAPRKIDVLPGNPNLINVWAPEMFYVTEEKEWYIYWSSTIRGEFAETEGQVDKQKNHRIYYMTTGDFRTFSDPKIFYDPGFPVIDASIQKEKDTYYMFIKDERDRPLKKQIHITTAKNILGPWSSLSDPITWTWTEGPSLIRIGNEYILYFDQYRDDKGMKALKSTDLKEWVNITEQTSFAPGAKHGSFIKISIEEAERLMRAAF